MNECQPGKLYMVAAGLGWMFVGRFVRPAGLLGGVFDPVVNLCRTGGVPWDDLCRGRQRPEATYRAYDGPLVLPAVTFCVPWEGEMPETTGGRVR